MKTLNYLLAFAFLAGLGFFTSCTDDASDAEPPTVTVSVVGTPDYSPGSSVVYEVSASSNDELERLTVTGDNINPNVTKDYEKDTYTSKDEVTVDVPASLAAGTEVTLSFTVTTTAGGEEVSEQKFTVAQGMPAMAEYKSVTFTYTSTNLNDKNIFSAAEGGLISGSGDASKMDLVFCYNGAVGFNSIVSPDGAWLESVWFQTSWSSSGKRSTAIATTSTDYGSADAATLAALNVTSASVSGGGNGVQELASGTVLAFQTADGQKGLLKVTGTQYKRLTATLTADIKVQAASATAK